MTSHRLKTDAKNRTYRTFLQGLGFAVLAAIVMVLLPVFTNAKSWDDFHWKLLAFSLVQVVGTAILAYIMRTVLDPSKVPTPLPPANPEGGQIDLGTVGFLFIVLTFIGVALLLFRVHLGG